MEQKGEGFTPFGEVQLFFTYPDEKTDGRLRIEAAQSGAFAQKYCWTANDPGDYWFWAADLSTGETSQKVRYQFIPLVSVSPEAGPVGTEFMQGGEGFTRNGMVQLYFRYPNGTIDSKLIVAADAFGKISHEYTSKPGDAVGTYGYWAVDLTSGKHSPEVSYSFQE